MMAKFCHHFLLTNQRGIIEHLLCVQYWTEQEEKPKEPSPGKSVRKRCVGHRAQGQLLAEAEVELWLQRGSWDRDREAELPTLQRLQNGGSSSLEDGEDFLKRLGVLHNFLAAPHPTPNQNLVSSMQDPTGKTLPCVNSGRILPVIGETIWEGEKKDRALYDTPRQRLLAASH